MNNRVQPKKIGVLVSGGGSNLQALIDHTKNQSARAEITCVISNQADAYALVRASQHGIATYVVTHQEYAQREQFDDRLATILHGAEVDLVVLAGFMRILGPNFVRQFEGRLLNIHPSLLPAYPGLHTHARVLENGDKTHGCSVHFVISKLDAGPVILQASVPVCTGDTPTTLAARVLQKEHIIYPLCVQWFCEGNLSLHEGSIWVHGKKIDAPIQLSDLT